jgi:hypothetical protein
MNLSRYSKILILDVFLNSTLQLFGPEGLEIFALGVVYFPRKGFLTLSLGNKSASLAKAKRPRANRRGRRAQKVAKSSLSCFRPTHGEAPKSFQGGRGCRNGLAQ